MNYPFDAGTPVRDIAENLLCVQMESLADTAGQVDYNAINRAVNYMVQADRIVLFARSPNHYLAGMFARKLLALGCDAQLAPFGEAGLIAYGMGAGSCAILISYSGHNPAQEPMSHVPVLKKNRVPVIAITSAGGNYLSGHADAVLTVSSRER